MNNVLGFAQVPVVVPKDCTCSISSYSHVMTLIIKEHVLTEAKNAFFFNKRYVIVLTLDLSLLSGFWCILVTGFLQLWRRQCLGSLEEDELARDPSMKHLQTIKSILQTTPLLCPSSVPAQVFQFQQHSWQET